MDLRKINWPLWAGLLLSLIASFGFPLAVFLLDAPINLRWGSLALFGIAAVLLVIGLRRAFSAGSRWPKVGASVAATLSVALCVLFILSTFVISLWLPTSTGAPQVGQKAPEFSLADTSGKVTTLSELLSTSNNQTPGVGSPRPRGVLLIFYRGYW